VVVGEVVVASVSVVDVVGEVVGVVVSVAVYWGDVVVSASELVVAVSEED
jgi:hypothetical protein